MTKIKAQFRKVQDNGLARVITETILVEELEKPVMTGFSDVNNQLPDNSKSSIINFGLSEKIVLSRHAKKVLEAQASQLHASLELISILSLDDIEPYDPGV